MSDEFLQVEANGKEDIALQKEIPESPEEDETSASKFKILLKQAVPSAFFLVL